MVLIEDVEVKCMHWLFDIIQIHKYKCTNTQEQLLVSISSYMQGQDLVPALGLETRRSSGKVNLHCNQNQNHRRNNQNVKDPRCPHIIINPVQPHNEDRKGSLGSIWTERPRLSSFSGERSFLSFSFSGEIDKRLSSFSGRIGKPVRLIIRMIFGFPSHSNWYLSNSTKLLQIL